MANNFETLARQLCYLLNKVDLLKEEGQNIDPFISECKAAPGLIVLADLLTSKVFAGMDRHIVGELCQNLQIFGGLRSCHVVRVSAKN